MSKAIVNLAARAGLTRSTWLRRFALAVLARVGQHDATIPHHWVRGRKVRLHRFRHKGYWFYGRAREEHIMQAFARLVRPGDTVIELGGHIGYVSLYFADLVGPEGRVFVLEPSPDNLLYIRANVSSHPSITLVEAAASDRVGEAKFFVEDLTGQNSTLVKDYIVFGENRERAFSDASYRQIDVPTTTVDLFAATHSLRPNFIKIDVEGAELQCLRGSIETLKSFRPKLMVEVTHQKEAVFSLMLELGYATYDSSLSPVAWNMSEADPNVFFIHRDDTISA
jgi:FkbM family methyltransferase